MKRDALALDQVGARQRVAVIGSGIAGLSAAWLLHRHYDVVLYEAAPRLGGHTHTVDVTLEGQTCGVDTGFLVYNRRTYPHLCALFAQLGVETVESDMSFSVSIERPDLEWAGKSLGSLFAQPENLLRPRFWGLLADILRFNRQTTRATRENSLPPVTLGEYLALNDYGSAFRDWYLLPMASAIWSCPVSQMLDYPVAAFLQFCHNHGLLQILDRPQWRTVAGGARQYVERMAAVLPDIRIATPVRAVRRALGRVDVHCTTQISRFDQVIFACHPSQTLEILGEEATPTERAVLGAIQYQPNRAVLHTDAFLLPRRKKVWSAWNYTTHHGDDQAVSVSYLLNQLQPLPWQAPLIVTLNPTRLPLRARVIAEFDYEHPVFDAEAVAAQTYLPAIQGRHGSWFCGAWTGHGFHEDGLRSAVNVAAALGVAAPWQAAPLLTALEVVA